ncbi:hypothetical protein [Vibrio coralliilyticus]|uniref:hypothetical protein n=1 Tax=Vibrio coralliilyticus TaxID=190893 RepID=UPI0017BEA424|nr:hypothetical protein [Vibrio coralliilyticus]NUW69237.1 hypothetical protein [Vibrio coralliilyticus]
MRNLSSRIESPQQLAELKHRYGKEAEFVSLDGFPFNAFDLFWKLNGLGKDGTYLKTAWMLEKAYVEQLHIDIRLALARLAQWQAADSACHLSYFLNKALLTDFSLSSVKTFWRTATLAKKSTLKRLGNQLYKQNPKSYSETCKWLQSVSAGKIHRNIYHLQKGALSDIENQDFEVKLNHQINTAISKGFGPPVTRSDRLDAVGHLVSYRNLIGLRLMQALVRRPSNLRQLKWSDIIPVGATFIDTNVIKEFTFSDESELQVRMWKVKQGNRFRQACEREALLLNSKISKEILIFRQEYKRRLSLWLEFLGILLTENEQQELMCRCPVLFSDSLFKTKFRDKNQLFAAVGYDSHAFHLAPKTLIAGMDSIVMRLGIDSDRVSSGTVKVTNNRIRHTTGTALARAEAPALLIAKTLGNTLEAARFYIDLSDEQRATIDDQFSCNKFLINAFASNITELLAQPEFAIEDEFGNQAGQIKSAQHCVRCSRSRPLGCYGCDNFEALTTSNHRAILIQAQSKHDLRESLGEPVTALRELKKQIRYIQVTIELCDAAIAQGKVRND